MRPASLPSAVVGPTAPSPPAAACLHASRAEATPMCASCTGSFCYPELRQARTSASGVMAALLIGQWASRAVASFALLTSCYAML